MLAKVVSMVTGEIPVEGIIQVDSTKIAHFPNFYQ